MLSQAIFQYYGSKKSFYVSELYINLKSWGVYWEIVCHSGEGSNPENSLAAGQGGFPLKDFEKDLNPLRAGMSTVRRTTAGIRLNIRNFRHWFGVLQSSGLTPSIV